MPGLNISQNPLWKDAGKYAGKVGVEEGPVPLQRWKYPGKPSSKEAGRSTNNIDLRPEVVRSSKRKDQATLSEKG